MSKHLETDKQGRYSGRGIPLDELIIGEHAGSKSPLYYVPSRAITNNPNRWMVRSSISPGFIGAEQWTNTAVGAGSVLEDAAGLLFTNAAADNDLEQIQMLQAYTPAANKRAVAYARIQCSDATQSDLYFGFWSTDTSVVASEPSVGAYFKKDDGDTIINGRTNDAGGGTETASLITDFTAATDYDLAVVISPTSASAGTVSFHYKLASSTTWLVTHKTTDFPNAAVRFSFLIQNGEAVAKTMLASSWIVAWER